jgi:hypothetical protein
MQSDRRGSLEDDQTLQDNDSFACNVIWKTPQSPDMLLFRASRHYLQQHIPFGSSSSISFQLFFLPKGVITCQDFITSMRDKKISYELLGFFLVFGNWESQRKIESLHICEAQILGQIYATFFTAVSSDDLLGSATTQSKGLDRDSTLCLLRNDEVLDGSTLDEITAKAKCWLT